VITLADSSNKKTSKKTVKKTAAKKTVLKSKTTAKKTASKKTKAKSTVKKASVKKTVKKTAAKKGAANKSHLPVKAKKKIKPLNEQRKKEIVKKEEPAEYEVTAVDRGDAPMTMVNHLDEFRSRILKCLSSVIILTIAAFAFSDTLLDFIISPFEATELKLNIMTLTGGFVLKLKASVVVALMLSLPIILYQVWGFISPAIERKDRIFSRASIIMSMLLFYGGMAFVFFGLLSYIIPFLLDFVVKDMNILIDANNYMSFILMFCLSMGILFELPILILILTKIGLITPQFLMQKRKYAIVAIWIIAALITPADPLSQILVAIPLMFLYEISILLSKFVLIRKKKKEMADQ